MPVRGCQGHCSLGPWGRTGALKSPTLWREVISFPLLRRLASQAEGEKPTPRPFSGFRVEVMVAWAGRAAGMERREQNLETQRKWERKFSLTHLGENGRKEMSKGNRRGRKKPKARSGSTHSCKTEAGKCGEGYKGATFFFFSSAKPLQCHLTGWWGQGTGGG